MPFDLALAITILLCFFFGVMCGKGGGGDAE